MSFLLTVEFEPSVQYYASQMVPPVFFSPAAFGPGSGNGFGKGGPGVGTQAVLAQKDVSKSLALPSRKRIRFPETWLWLNTTTK